LNLVQERTPDLEYSVRDHGDRLLILNNADGAKDFKISQAPLATPSKEHWVEFMPYQAGLLIKSIDVYSDFLAFNVRSKGLPGIMVHQFETGETHPIEFHEEAYMARGVESREWTSANLRYVYESLTTPSTVYDYDMGTRKKTFRKQQPVLGGFDATRYESKRMHATASDGTRVPISLVYRRDTALDGSSPLLLNGYGSYGASLDASFGLSPLPLLDRGFVYAIAHVRGGMEMGWDWYENGKKLKKMNTFTDFIACAEHLINEKITHKGGIVAKGGSAGGILMGAIMNLRPDLFHAVIASVPFVDCLNTMLDASLPLTPGEYNEWGNPEDEEYYHYMKSYSPYDNVTEQAYPHTLITAGLNDPRVTYWEPAKWAQILREKTTSDNLILFQCRMESGHGGVSGRFDYLKEIALKYAFILKVFDRL